MALVVADRVKETTSTAGTGTLTLAGAATGFQSFAVIGNGNQTYYTIAGQGTSEWEVGIGTYTSSGTTLSRDSVLSSSAGGAKVTFSAGTKDVFVVYPSGRAVYGDTVGNVTITKNFQAARLTASASTSNATLIYGDAYSVSGASAVPMIDMSGVWNTTGAPTLVKYNVTNTASGTNSLLLDLQTSGTSRFKVDKNGNETITGALVIAGTLSGATTVTGAAVSISGGFTGTTGTITNLTATNETVTSLTATNETVTSLTVTNETVSTITGTANSLCDMDTIQGDVLIATATPANTQIFFSDSGSISGSSAVALFDIAATWNTTGSPTGFKLNVADSASADSSLLMDLQTSNTSRFRIPKNGFVPSAGTGITAGTGTVFTANSLYQGSGYYTSAFIDVTGLNSGAAGDIIGVNGSANPAYIGRITTPVNGVIRAVRMTCLEVPAGTNAATDIDLYSATEGTGTEDLAITTLTETQIIDAGAAWTLGLAKFGDSISADQYLYLVGQNNTGGTYTAGKFLIEFWGS